MKDSFVFYRSFFESTKGLPDESRLRLFDNICELALNDRDIDGLHGIEVNIFTLIRPQIEANNQRYENGKKGGRPSKKTNGYKKEKTIGYETEKPNVNVNDNVNENIYKKKYFDNEELNETFLEFLEMRKKIKAVNTPKAIKALTNTLEKYDDNTKIEMINKSIVNSWKDVYPLKNEEKVTSTKKYNDLN
jgi:hypothetical protein